MLLIGYLIIQLIVQYILYTTVRPLVLSFGKLVYFITENKHITKKTLLITMLIVNITISIAVKWFTAAGAMAGLSNLAASAVIGILMAIDTNKLLGDDLCLKKQ